MKEIKELFSNIPTIGDRTRLLQYVNRDGFNTVHFLNILEGNLDWIPYNYSTVTSDISFKKDHLDFIKNNSDNCLIVTNWNDKDMAFIYKKDDIAMYVYIQIKKKGPIINTINFAYKNQESLVKLLEFIKQTFDETPVKKEDKLSILLLQHNKSGFYTRLHSINPVTDIGLNINYNNDFEKDVHNKVMKYITTDSKSMTIFQGLPGTGKTTYVKYLMSCLASVDKDVLYLPPNLTSMLSQPDFMDSVDLLKDKVVIIEDAEEILVQKTQRSQAISNILNISDGILSDVFNIHFIFTFNIGVNKIDPALLRKGRLNLKYEFQELSKENSKLLCEKLNVEWDSSCTTLANIYNKTPNTTEQKQEKIGFNIN